MGHLTIETGMIDLRAARKQKVEATARLQAFGEAVREAKQLQENLKAENFKPPTDEWGNPIKEGGSPQNPLQGAEIEGLPF